VWVRIGQVAAAAQVHQDTLRLCEREGLLRKPPRAANGHRDYPADTVALVRFIKRAQELGFSLSEARELSELRAAPGRNRLKVRALAAAKQRDVERRIADLTEIRTSLEGLIRSCCKNDDPCCPILESLNSRTPPVRRQTSSPKGLPR
jgi:DNA-binding transcriptional MerR regulator